MRSASRWITVRLLQLDLLRSLCVLWFGCVLATGATPLARITVVAVDSFGASFGKLSVLMLKNDKGRDFSSRFVGSLGREIPFGEYMIRVETASGGLITQRVLVQQPDCLLVLARNPITVEYAPDRGPVLSGKILPTPESVSIVVWVKLCGLYIDGCETSLVKEDGSFSLISLIPASYVVSVLGTTGEIMSERVDIHHPRSVLILYPSRLGHDRVQVSGQP